MLETLRHVLMVFTRSGITPPKVNRFDRSEYILGGWSWQILVAICAVARAEEPEEMSFFSDKQRTNLPTCRRPNFTRFEHNTSTGVAMNPFGIKFGKFPREGSFLEKKPQKT